MSDNVRDLIKKPAEGAENGSQAMIHVWLGGAGGREIYELLDEYRAIENLTWKKLVLLGIAQYLLVGEGEYDKPLSMKVLEYVTAPNLKPGVKARKEKT